MVETTTSNLHCVFNFSLSGSWISSSNMKRVDIYTLSNWVAESRLGGKKLVPRWIWKFSPASDKLSSLSQPLIHAVVRRPRLQE